MPTFKYYDKILAAQSRSTPPGLPSAFDLKKGLGSSGTVKRLISGVVSRLMPVVFRILRTVWPVPRIGRLVLVTRYDDVADVLGRPGDFEVPYGPEMIELAGGANFALGMEGDPHTAQNAIIRQVLRHDDVPVICAYTRYVTKALIAGSGGRLNVMQDLFSRVTAETCGRYFGLDLEDPDLFADCTLALSALLFADPFGKEATRQTALAGAARLHTVIDRAIKQAQARAQTHPRPDAVVDRLVAIQLASPTQNVPSDGEIRAILVGLATGFIPTTGLAAPKILLELLRRPDALAQAKEKARAGDRDGLRKILLEAGRLNPALAPGQWRYAKQDTTIGKTKVRAKSVLMVATMSALRDGRKFETPTRFRTDRSMQPDLMFGWGEHACLGKYLATEQMTDIFQILLSQPGLRTAPDAGGKLTSVGPFPRRLDMVFDAATPASQTMVVVCAPVVPGMIDHCRDQIQALGNPARPEIAATLTDTGLVHFASLSVIDVGDAQAPKPHLLLELNVDGSREVALGKVAVHAGIWLEPIFQHVQDGGGVSLGELLTRHALNLQTYPWGAIGLNFNGTPDFPVADITRQDKLAAFARDAIKSHQREHFEFGSRPIRIVDHVRKLIQQDDDLVRKATTDPALQELLDRGNAFADFLLRPSGRRLALSEWKERTAAGAWLEFATTRSACRVWVLALAVAAMLTVVVDWSLGSSLAFDISNLLESPVASLGRIMLALVGGIVATGLLFGTIVAIFLAVLRWHETRDQPDDQNPSVAHLRRIAVNENHPGFAQNHITAVTHLKPGWFRRLTTALAMWGIGKLVTHKYRPGFVVNIGTIHYAKWFRVPGSEKLIFLANYDGSWESYLEDFITKAHQGQSAAWSNGVGFPRTRFLVLDGAQDGDRFKRWVRRQQVPTQFWYSRFPHLTTDQIRINALIHDGLMRARTDSAAQAWLDCFGSMPRPDYAIESMEVQSMVFRALSDLSHTACVVLRLPADVQDSKAWLRDLLPSGTDPKQLPESGIEPLTFGDRPPARDASGHRTATFVAFSAAGLKKLGVPEAGMATFPGPFVTGMANRSRVLGDVGASAPDAWRWADVTAADGQAPPAADAVLFIYADSAAKRARTLEAHKRKLGAEAFIDVILTEPVSKGTEYEHFGYRDGISQPVIRGTQRFSKGAVPADIVAPGELILGYRNNQDYFPPTVAMPPDFDPGNLLPADNQAITSRFPRFRALPTDAPRDFGRNGTFIALRQLEQDVEGFDSFIKAKATELAQYANLPDLVGGPITPDWVAAKMMGRWRDGTPLIDRPADQSRFKLERRRRRRGAETEDQPTNDFNYGIEDPQGFFCPFGAHTRRANPRDSLQPGDPKQLIITNRHRLLRRGRSYVTPADEQKREEKGLLFVGVCADLERQFEFIQQSWIGSPSFHGLNDEPDPITAPDVPCQQRVFTIPTPAGAVVLRGMQSFVTVRAGGYFFMPSHAAIRFMIDL
ncbi:cytochrome P450 [Vineibacter terrae]|uniref:Cytochrome P450 n=1 Tax=Vineibacter terrae TaxID=2586908 RepID=A0A5C8PV50_9HYPH|nr:cytochrome P450 [Vineibacter terrae]TXL82188.1 cytochrome P450 [Vineibacter terrae]